MADKEKPADNIRVAVRVRPFSKREIESGSVRVIQIDGPSVALSNPSSTGKEWEDRRVFTYDYAYDSSSTPSDPKYATQEQVYNDLGVQSVQNAWQGFNVSVFAYGQTGSGKTYSMMGYGTDRGLIPRICEELFSRVASSTDPEVTYAVEVSYMEIYNEVIRDLFMPEKSNTPGGLKMRENPTTGPYVEALSRIGVSRYPEVEELLEEGARIRTVAATNMNKLSSRSHAIFTLRFVQTKPDKQTQKIHQKVSLVHLVDLAGSERVDVQSAVTGSGKGPARGTIAEMSKKAAGSIDAADMRLKEGAAINKSLSALSNVIYALAEMQTSKKKDTTHIPYRDSVLTWLLKESLGGNAKTVMLATVSPCCHAHGESMSTLRYAERAKRIVNRAIVNEDQNTKLIRELREENQRLKEMLTAISTGGPAQIGAGNLNTLKSQIAQNEKLVAELDISPEEQHRKAEMLAKERHEQLQSMGLSDGQGKGFKLVNLNEDPLLSETLTFFIKPGVTRVGREDASVPQDIKLSGQFIQHEHCIFSSEKGAVEITPLNKSRTFVNGNLIAAATKVGPGTRVILGKNHVFRVEGPSYERNSISTEECDWYFAVNELAAVQGSRLQEDDDDGMVSVKIGRTTTSSIESAREKELEQKMKEMEEMLRKQREDFEKAQEEKRLLEEERRKDREEAEQKLLSQRQQYEKGLEEIVKAMPGPYASTANGPTPAEGALDSISGHSRTASLSKTASLSITPHFSRDVTSWTPFKKDCLEKLDKIRNDIHTANTMSIELSKDMTYELGVMTGPNLEEPGGVMRPPWEEIKREERWRPVVRVLQSVTRRLLYVVHADVFIERLPSLRLYHERINRGERMSGIGADTFAEPWEDCFIGRGWLYLLGLAHRLTMEHTLPVFDHHAHKIAELNLTLFPTVPESSDKSSGGEGRKLTPPAILDTQVIVGNPMNFSLRLNSASSVPSLYKHHVYCKYRFWHEREIHVTEKCSLISNQPRFNYQANYSVANVSQELLDYMRNSAICFELWAKIGDQAKQSMERTWEFFFKVDVEEEISLGKGMGSTWEPVMLKEQPLEKGGSVCIYKLRTGQRRRFVLSVQQCAAPDEDSVLEKCTSVRVGRLRRWQDGYNEVINATHFQVQNYEVKKVETGSKDLHEYQIICAMDAPLFDAEEFKRISAKGEVFSMAVCVDVKLHIISTPYRFTHEVIFKVIDKDSKAGGKRGFFWQNQHAMQQQNMNDRLKRTEQMGSRTRISLAPGKAAPEAVPGMDVMEAFDRDLARHLRIVEEEHRRQRSAVAQALELIFGPEMYRNYAEGTAVNEIGYPVPANVDDPSGKIGKGYTPLWVGATNPLNEPSSSSSSSSSLRALNGSIAAPPKEDPEQDSSPPPPAPVPASAPVLSLSRSPETEQPLAKPLSVSPNLSLSTEPPLPTVKAPSPIPAKSPSPLTTPRTDDSLPVRGPSSSPSSSPPPPPSSEDPSSTLPPISITTSTSSSSAPSASPSAGGTSARDKLLLFKQKLATKSSGSPSPVSTSQDPNPISSPVEGSSSYSPRAMANPSPVNLTPSVVSSAAYSSASVLAPSPPLSDRGSPVPADAGSSTDASSAAQSQRDKLLAFKSKLAARKQQT